MSNIVQFEDLQKATKLKDCGRIEKKLKADGIRFFYGKKGVIYTTLDLINAAGGLSKVELNKEKSEDII